MKAKGLRGQGNGLLQKLVSKKGLAAERKPSKSSVNQRESVSKILRVFSCLRGEKKPCHLCNLWLCDFCAFPAPASSRQGSWQTQKNSKIFNHFSKLLVRFFAVFERFSVIWGLILYVFDLSRRSRMRF